MRCTTVDLLSIHSTSSEVVNLVRPMEFETWVIVSSVSKAGIGLDGEAGLLSPDCCWCSSYTYTVGLQEIKIN